jgi:hypothetical protein
VEDSCEQDNEPSGSIKCWENFGVATQLAASREGPSSMGLAKGLNAFRR